MSDPSPPPASRWASPPEVPRAATPAASSLLAIVVAVVAVAALYVGREVLLPVTLALLLSFVLSPVVSLLRRLRLGRILSAMLAVLVALGIILALGTAIGTQVAQLAGNIPQYQTTIERKISTVRENTFGWLSGAIDRVGHELHGAAEKPAPPAAPAAAPAAFGGQTQQQQPVPVVITQQTPSALQIGEKVLTPLLNPLATAGIILVVTIFALLQKEDLRDRAIRLFGSGDLQRTTVAMNEAGRRLSRYFLTQLAINTSFGVIVALGLWFIGVPNPVLWGTLGLLLRFIPYIGSWIAAALPIALAAAVEPGWSMAIWTAALYIVTELVMGQVVEPMVYGHSTGLSPFAVVVAAIFWTWIWGPIGLVISTPLTLCFVVLGRHVERLEFLDVLLGDRPPLTPVESFYQRMLAGDPDEALDQAERYLVEHSLSSYYDEVALQGLQLAANDVIRDVLSPDKVERFKSAVNELVRDLDGYDDEPPKGADRKKTVAGPSLDEQALPNPPPPAGQAEESDAVPPEWRSETPVLCVAGRGPLDEAASSMLAQLLGKHGLGARVLPYEAVSRSNIGAVDLRDVAMVCVSYIDISGNPPHLRYLLHRLRQRLPPRARLLVGLWPADDPVLRNPELGRAIGADYYANTLRQAVEKCFEARSTARPEPPAVPSGRQPAPSLAAADHAV